MYVSVCSNRKGTAQTLKESAGGLAAGAAATAGHPWLSSFGAFTPAAIVSIFSSYSALAFPVIHGLSNWFSPPFHLRPPSTYFLRCPQQLHIMGTSTSRQQYPAPRRICIVGGGVAGPAPCASTDGGTGGGSWQARAVILSGVRLVLTSLSALYYTNPQAWHAPGAFPASLSALR